MGEAAAPGSDGEHLSYLFDLMPCWTSPLAQTDRRLPGR